MKVIPCFLMANVRTSNQIQLFFLHIPESVLLSHGLLRSLSGTHEHSERRV